jgi:hypothetical protein
VHWANSEIAGLKGLRLKRLQSMKMGTQPARIGRNLEVDAAEVIPIPFDDFEENLASISRAYRL